jgi:hypothetical protein
MDSSPLVGVVSVAEIPYCINIHDGERGPLYVADHERVGPDGYDRDEAISVVFQSYEELLHYLPEKKNARQVRGGNGGQAP